MEAIQQAVFPIVYSAVCNQLPTDEQSRWSSAFYNVIASNMRINYEHTELDAMMKNAGIPYVILKGVASDSYYPEPNLRTMGDVDFLVYKADFNRVCLLMESEGFERIEETDAHFAYRRSSGSIWEVHWQMSGIPQGDAGNMVHKALDNLIETGHESNNVVLPDDFHHGLIMLVHMANHMTNTGVGLRHLCDWAVFVNHMADFELMFKETLQGCGLWRYAQLLTQLSIKYLHIPEQSWAMEDADDGLLEAMMCDIFDSGNFGSKNSERINQAKLMTNMSTGQIDGKSMVGKVCSVMNAKARASMPICDKYSVLLPVGWIYTGGRHLVRIAQGKRPKIHVNSMVEGAKKRREIYKEFHLYES
jgi:hypothetical protein